MTEVFIVLQDGTEITKQEFNNYYSASDIFERYVTSNRPLEEWVEEIKKFHPEITERCDDFGCRYVTEHKLKSEDFLDLQELENKYFQLVWYARSDSMEPNIVAKRKEVEEKFPTETKALASKSGNWEHGFNSGMLAGMRLVLGLTGCECERDSAWEEFPMLDS